MVASDGRRPTLAKAQINCINSLNINFHSDMSIPHCSDSITIFCFHWQTIVVTHLTVTLEYAQLGQFLLASSKSLSSQCNVQRKALDGDAGEDLAGSMCTGFEVELRIGWNWNHVTAKH